VLLGRGLLLPFGGRLLHLGSWFKKKGVVRRVCGVKGVERARCGGVLCGFFVVGFPPTPPNPTRPPTPTHPHPKLGEWRFGGEYVGDGGWRVLKKNK